jgi:hypothetical protein
VPVLEFGSFDCSGAFKVGEYIGAAAGGAALVKSLAKYGGRAALNKLLGKVNQGFIKSNPGGHVFKDLGSSIMGTTHNITGKVTINSRLKVNDIIETILHEYSHASTVNALPKPLRHLRQLVRNNSKLATFISEFKAELNATGSVDRALDFAKQYGDPMGEIAALGGILGILAIASSDEDPADEECPCD